MADDAVRVVEPEVVPEATLIVGVNTVVVPSLLNKVFVNVIVTGTLCALLDEAVNVATTEPGE